MTTSPSCLVSSTLGARRHGLRKGRKVMFWRYMKRESNPGEMHPVVKQSLGHLLEMPDLRQGGSTVLDLYDDEALIHGWIRLMRRNP